MKIKALMVGSAWVMGLGAAVSGLLGVGLRLLMAALFVSGRAGVIPNAISGIWVAAPIGVPAAPIGVPAAPIGVPAAPIGPV